MFFLNILYFKFIRKGNLYNGFIFENNNNLNFILKKKNFYKLNYNINQIESRIEVINNINFIFYKYRQWVFFFYYLYSICNFKKNFLEKKNLNIFFLDLINTYRGWRHSVGLPVRGQRTWSNANTVYKNNLNLRYFKMNLIKKLYNTVSNQTVNLIYSAEQFNLLWKLQWELEWKEAKKKKVFFLKKKHIRDQISLNSIVENQNLNMKDKKVAYSNKNFSFGYDKGFTKMLLKLNLKVKKIKK